MNWEFLKIVFKTPVSKTIFKKKWKEKTTLDKSIIIIFGSKAISFFFF